VTGLVRNGLRRRARALLLLALVVAIAGGVAITGLAGARRTNTAVTRFEAYAVPLDTFVGTPDSSLYGKIARLPMVAAWAKGAFLALAPLDRQGHLDRSVSLNTFGVHRIHGVAQRPLVLAGHPPSPTSSVDVVINPGAAADEHLGIGDELRFRAFAPDQIAAVLRGSDEGPRGPVIVTRIAAIERTLQDLSVAPQVPGVVYQGVDNVYFGPGFFAKYGAGLAPIGGTGLSVRLVHGRADYSRFRSDVLALSHGKAFVAYGSDDLTAAAHAQRATRFTALALLVFAVLAAVLTFAMIAQALTRQAQSDADELRTLRALGVTRRQLVLASSVRAGLLAVAGATLAVVIAYLASPTMPIGIAREAEVSPGFSADWPVFLVSAAAIVTFVVTWAVIALRSAVRQATDARPLEQPGRARKSRVAERLSRAGAPPAASIGVRMALEAGRGVSVRTTLVGATVAVTAVTATLCFGSNMTRLASQPRLQGWTWDVAVGNPHSGDVRAEATRKLAADPMVAGYTAVAGPVDVHVSGSRTDGGLVELDPIHGDLYPPVTAGHAPMGADEVAMGALTLRQLHKSVGDAVTMSVNGHRHTFRISGQVVLNPTIVNDQMPLGQAAVVTAAGMQVLGADSPDLAPVNVFLVRFRPGVDHAAAMQRMQQDFPHTVLTPVRPPDIENFRRVEGFPTLLALLFALVALLTVGHTLVSSVRRRRSDLAVLRTVGFLRRQVSVAVAWQATTIAVIALAFGVPLGIAAGRWAWTFVTDQLGLPAIVTVPLYVAAIVPAVLFMTNAVAALPGLMAGRIKPAAILRSE
jgi:putative ABC transport system permease protein